MNWPMPQANDPPPQQGDDVSEVYRRGWNDAIMLAAEHLKDELGDVHEMAARARRIRKLLID